MRLKWCSLVNLFHDGEQVSCYHVCETADQNWVQMNDDYELLMLGCGMLYNGMSILLCHQPWFCVISPYHVVSYIVAFLY